MTQSLEREALLPRMDGIRKNIAKLRELAALPQEQFKIGDPFDLAQHHLRLALEGIFHIGSHILSRLPGGRTVEYREIASKLGELGVVPQEFSERALVPMANLRNLLVHQYADLDPIRIQTVLQIHLGDVETFLSYIRELIEHPEKFGLQIT